MTTATFTFEQLQLLISPLVRPPPPPPPPPSGLGNPGPLGLGGFALTTFMLSVAHTGVFLDPKAASVVVPVALFYGGVAQFAAGLFEVQNKNTFGATVFSSFGAFWMSYAALAWFVVPSLVAAGVDPAGPVGLFLLAWLIFTTFMTVASYRVSVAVFAIFLALWPTFLLLTIGALAHSEGCTRAGGWLGIICAFCAWYGCAAVSINSSFGRTILPIGTHVQPEAMLQAASAATAHWQAATALTPVQASPSDKAVALTIVV